LAPLRERISCLTSLGGSRAYRRLIFRAPRPVVPPVGLSIIGARGSDLDLPRVTVAFEAQAAEKAYTDIRENKP
jgi:amidase